jgi:hypothetical protein
MMAAPLHPASIVSLMGLETELAWREHGQFLRIEEGA